MAKKTPAFQLDRDIAEVLHEVPPPRVTDLDRYKRLAQLAAQWARGKKAAPPALRPYLRRVRGDIDRQFWLGEVLDDIRRKAEGDLSGDDVRRYERFVDLLTAPEPRTR